MIKNLPLVFLFMLTGALAHAQIRKGSLFLGGSARYAIQKSQDQNSTVASKTRYLTLSPAIGKVVKENLVLGVETNYSSTLQKNLTTESYKEKIYGGGLFLRRYMHLGKNFYFFGHSGAGIRFSNTEFKLNPGQDNKGYSIGLGLHPGVSYAINNKIYIESELNNIFFAEYSRVKRNPNTTMETRSSNFNIGTSFSNPINLSIGFRLIL